MPAFGARYSVGAWQRPVRRRPSGALGNDSLVGVGIALGIATSFWSSRFIASLLYGVSPADPLVVGGAAVMLGIVGFIAAWLPAYRASLTDPAMVLRQTT